MPNRVARVQNVAQATAKRALLRDLVALSGLALCVGGALGGVTIVATRLAGWSVSWPIVLGGTLAASFAGASIIAAGKRWSTRKGARHLDAHYQSQD